MSNAWRPLGDQLADAAEADHAEGLAVELVALVARRAPTRRRPATPCACGTLRQSARASASVCSAAATEFDSGALATMIPRLVAASMSTLSTPVPARPITFRWSARSISSGSSLVRRADQDRVVTRRSARRAPRSDMSMPSSTSKCSRSRSTPASAIFSLTSTRGIGIGRAWLGLSRSSRAPRRRSRPPSRRRRSAPRRRRARPPGTSRPAAGCGRACGRARRRRCRSRAGSPASAAASIESSKSIVPTTSERLAGIG